MTERETVQKPDTGAQANDAETPTNIVPCRRCKQPHSFRWNDPEKRHEGGSWADPVDGHAFRPMTAEEVVRFVRRQMAALLEGEASRV